jgi:hypothetical protein
MKRGMKKTILYGFSLFLLLCSCQPARVTPRSTLPQEFTTGYQEIYGRFYDSIPYSVVALDLYSDGLELDSTHRMQGTGYNLYLSDIFVPDSLLAEGQYTSIPQDSLSSFSYAVSAYSFLLGRDYEGSPHGIYLLYIEEGKLQNIQVLDSGLFVVRDTTNGLTNVQFTLYYTNAENRVNTYEAHFQGALIPWPKQ